MDKDAKILTRLTQQIKDSSPGVKDPRAAAIVKLQQYGIFKEGTEQLTAHGKTRNEMSAEDRAKDRASKRSGHPTSAYTYDAKTNAATLKPKSKFPKKI
jgi:hypothetical protein